MSRSQTNGKDNSIFRVDTLKISNAKFIRTYKNNTFYSLTNVLKDTILDTILSTPKVDNYFEDVKFVDFDKDGFLDIQIFYLSNTPGDGCIYLFDNISSTFRLLENDPYRVYVDPKIIRGTKYFYTYCRGGCADKTWNSDLFIIEKFKAKRVGNIHGDGCGDGHDGIFISTVSDDIKTIIKTLPISTIKKYKHKKFDFIKDFWTKNYSDFKK